MDRSTRRTGGGAGMVTDAVLDWFFGLLDWLVTGLPTGELPFDGFGFGFISDMNYFLPIGEMFSVFMGFLLLGGPMAVASIVIWLLVGVIRGGATKA